MKKLSLLEFHACTRSSGNCQTRLSCTLSTWWNSVSCYMSTFGKEFRASIIYSIVRVSSLSGKLVSPPSTSCTVASRCWGGNSFTYRPINLACAPRIFQFPNVLGQFSFVGEFSGQKRFRSLLELGPLVTPTYYFVSLSSVATSAWYR